MNSMAKICRTRDAVVEMDQILNVGGFNLDRALEIDPKFMEPEYPFEWSGIYELNTGTYEWVMSEGPDPVMGAALLPLADTRLSAKEETLMDAVLTFSEDEQAAQAGETLHLGKGQHNQLVLNKTARPSSILRSNSRAITCCSPNITLMNSTRTCAARRPCLPRSRPVSTSPIMNTTKK